MKYNDKLPKNNKGYIVSNRVFVSLRDAEVYCDKLDLDPNDCIEYDVVNAKRIARNNLNTCQVLLESLQSQYDDNTEYIEAITKNIKTLNANPTRMSLLNIGLAMNNLKEVGNFRSGIGISMTTVRQLKIDSEDIIRQ